MSEKKWVVDLSGRGMQGVLNNLNTHSPASLYAAFPAAKARRLVRKLEFHHTPKHGSWLNVAECELAVLATQCLDRRLPDLATVAREVTARETRCNRERPTVKWHFTTAQARRKLRPLYPAPGVINVEPDCPSSVICQPHENTRRVAGGA